MKKVSKISVLSEDEKISIEAASWVTKLDSGNFSDADRILLSEWMTQSPHHESEIKRLLRLWGNVDLFVDNTAALSSADQGLSRLLPVWFSLQPIRMSAVFLIPLLFFVITLYPGIWGTDESPQFAVYRVEKGGNENIRLADGSRVHLNTNSIVEVQYTKDFRVVRLLQGEALFDVVKDSARPFQVHAASILVEAVGTAFLVRLYEQDVGITVTEGSVRLEPSDLQILAQNDSQNKTENELSGTVLEAGHRVRISEALEDIKPIGKREIQNSMAWRDGLLVFEGESLEYVVNEVGRYMPQAIIISDPELRTMQMGGVFKIGEIDTLLSALETSLGIEVNHVRPDLIYLNNNSNK